MDDYENFGIIILAAGGSSRLGSPKQLLNDREAQSLIRRVCKLALTTPIRKIAVVLGHDHPNISPEISDLDISILINKDWQTGIASSIRSGLAFFISENPEQEALIFLVCDQPFVNKAVIESIINQYSKSGKAIVASHYQDILGTPALFHRSLFPQLMKLQGDRGAGKFIQDHLEQVAIVEFQAGIFDIDTKRDYDSYIG